MKKPFGQTKFGSVIKVLAKGILGVAVDIIPAGESVKKIIQNVAANSGSTTESTGNTIEVVKIIRVVIVGGLIVAFLMGKIDGKILMELIETVEP